DFDFDALQDEACDHRGAGGFVVAKVFRVNGVHGGKILGVGEKDRAPHDIRHGGAAAFENQLDIVQYATGFDADIAADHLVAGRIHGDLARYVDEIAGAHRGRIGTTWGGNAGGRNALDHGLVSFRFEESFDFDGSHAARTGSRDGLA